MTSAMSPRQIRELTVFQLVPYANCLHPDAIDSAGSQFLTKVRDDVLETWDEMGWLDERERENECYRIANEAPDHHTHHKWLEFVDLGGYQEDMDGDDWDEASDRALVQIAERLARELYESLILWDEEQDEEEEDDDEDN